MLDLNSQPTWQPILQNLLSISQKLHQSVLQQQKPSPIPPNLQAYSYVYDQCISKPSRSQAMLSKFKQLLLGHLKRTIAFKENCNMIKEFNDLWLSYGRYAKFLAKKVFGYLDRYFLQGREIDTLQQIAVDIFNTQILGTEHKRTMFINFFVRNLGQMRNEMTITKNYLWTFTDNLLIISPKLFQELHKVFICQTQNFYKYKFLQCKYLTPLFYYNQIRNLIHFEYAIRRLCISFPQSFMMKTQLILTMLFFKELIQPYTDILLEHPQGLIWALKNKKIQLLNVVVEIHSVYEGFDKIKLKYYDYLVQQGKKLIESFTQSQSQLEKITKISQFFDDRMQTLTVGFYKNQQLYATQTNAMQTVIGKWSQLNEVLFNFCKKSVQNGSFNLSKSIVQKVFQKLASKDEFLHKCEQWIQNIILKQEWLIQKVGIFIDFVHQVCGGEKLHKLITDYKQNQIAIQVPQVNCKVLSSQMWQAKFKNQISIRPNLPQYLQAAWNAYSSRFIQGCPKKQLTFMPLSTKIQLQLRLNSKSVSVRCNLLQTCILYALLDGKKPIQQLMAQLVIQKDLVLAFARATKLIMIQDDIVSIDWDCQMPQQSDLSVQIQTVQNFTKAIEQDRNILMEAGVVRFLKRTKEATFEDIYDSLCHSIKLFRPQPSVVKTVIEKMIRRDFIQQNEQGLYIYKA